MPVTWPDAPKLPGITMLLLQRQLTAADVPQAEAPVCMRDLASYAGMILCNSHGALFEKSTGYCVAGPCAGQALERVALEIADGYVLLAEQAPEAPAG